MKRLVSAQNATLKKAPFSLLLFFQNSFFPEFLKLGNSPWKRDPEILLAQFYSSLHIQIPLSQQKKVVALEPFSRKGKRSQSERVRWSKFRRKQRKTGEASSCVRAPWRAALILWDTAADVRVEREDFQKTQLREMPQAFWVNFLFLWDDR